MVGWQVKGKGIELENKNGNIKLLRRKISEQNKVHEGKVSRINNNQGRITENE